MSDTETSNLETVCPSSRPRGRPKQYLTDEEWREAKRAIAKQTYQKMAEKVKEAARIYKAANIDKIRETQREI